MKKIVFLLISIILCISLGIAVVAAVPDKVGYISNTNGDDANDGLSDATPKFYQGQVNGIGLRNLMYGGGTIVVCGDFGIGSDQVWDYGGPTIVTGCYNGKDYKNYFRSTGIFNLGAGVTLTVTNSLTFDDILIYPEEPNCKILVPNGATLTITETVSILTDALAIEVEEGGKANILGGKYLAIDGKGEINLGENVEVLGGEVVFVSKTSGDNTNDGLSDINPKRDLGTINRPGIFNQIKGGGTIVASGDFFIPGDYDWNFVGGITVTGNYNGKDYKALGDYRGVVRLDEQATLTVRSDLTIDNALLSSGKYGSIILVKSGATLTITDTVETKENSIAIIVEKGGTAKILGGTYLAVQGGGEITVGAKAKVLQDKATVYLSAANGSDDASGLSVSEPKKQLAQDSGISVNTLLSGGGTLVLCGDLTVAFNDTWKYGGPLTVTGNYGGKDYKNAIANTGVLQIADGKAMTLKSDLTLDNLLLRPGKTISGIRVMSGATLTITESVEFLDDTMVIIVEAGGTANIESGTYKAILGKGTIRLGENVKTLDEEIPCFISNKAGNDNNSGISDVSPRRNQGQRGGLGARGMLHTGGTLVASGEFNIASNYTWDYGGEVTLTGSYGGKDYKNKNASTGIFKLAKGCTLTLGSDLVMDDILFQPGEETAIRVPQGRTLTITESVQILTNHLVIWVDSGGTAKIEGGTYKSIQGSGTITIGEKVELPQHRVGYISNTSGNDSNDGLSDETPKFYQGQVGGIGLRNLIYGGGIIVACGDFGIGSDQVWDYGGPTVVTGCYNGKNYKDYDLNMGIFNLGAGVTLTVTNSLTFDDILFVSGENSVVLVPDGATVRFTEKVDFQSNTLNIVVEKGGTAILDGGTYASVTGEGEIRKAASVKILGGTGVNVPTSPGIAYISNATGKNSNDGLSAAASKQYLGAESGNGARNLLAAGGTLVVSGDCEIKKNMDWEVGGAVTITAKANNTDYRNAAAGNGTIPFMPNVILTVKSDLALENVIIVPSDTFNIIRVQSGATLTVGENVEVLVPNLVIEVEQGGKAIVESGSYLAIRGKGDITVSDAVKIVTRIGVIDPAAPATSAQGKKVGFISNTSGNDNNDGLSDATPKFQQGQVSGIGLRNLMYGGGTIVVCGDLGVGSNQVWDYGGAVTVTGCYGGKDYRNHSGKAGLFNLHSNKTLTVKCDLTMTDILLQLGENSMFRVNNQATFCISDTVTILNEQGYEAGKWNLTVEKGSVVILSKRVAGFFSIDGEGEVVIFEPTVDTDAGEGTAGDPDIIPNTPVEDGVVFLSGTDGSNDNDGLSAKTPKKSFGSPFGNGVSSVLLDGGKLVLSGDLALNGNHTWSFGGAVTVTASYGGVDYKDSASAEPATGCLKLASGAILTVASDLTLDDMLLFLADGENTIKVSGATLTVTDTVQLLSGTGGTPACKLILEDDATVVLPKDMQSLFTVEGGTVLTYEQ